MDAKVSITRILKKPPVLIVVPILYFFTIMFAKWQLNLPLGALLFFLGGVLGIYLLDIAEEIFDVKPSPFRTTLFVIGLGITGIYTLTSTREMIASGLVLGLMASIFLYQVSEWKIHRNLDSWYSMFLTNISRSGQKIGLIVLGIVLLLETVIFITG